MANQQSMVISNSEELCNWEFVHQSDCSSAGFSDDDGSIFEVLSLSSMSSSDLESDDQEGNPVHVHVDEDHDHQEEEEAMKDVPINEVVLADLGINEDVNSPEIADYGLDLSNCVLNYRDYDDFVRPLRYFATTDDVDEEEEDDDDDMDDDLVPWEMKGLYMRQRIRKTGKKSQMVKSKKTLGSVRGKYGAGLKGY